MHSSDQIKCCLVQAIDKIEDPKFILTHKDGIELSREEVIDIGQEEWKYKYPEEKTHFTWKFLDHTPDMRIQNQIKAFQTAFNSIEKVTTKKIDFERDQSKETDITVEWMESLHVFDDRLSVLAQAYFFMPNGGKNGVIQFNDSPESKWYFTALGWPVPAYLVDSDHFVPGQRDENGNLIMRASQPVVHISMHELGHTFGLRHDLIHQASLMYPSAKRGYVFGEINRDAFVWQSPDINRWSFYYGDPGTTNTELFRWRDYRTTRSIYERF